jgi:hypothetical protein
MSNRRSLVFCLALFSSGAGALVVGPRTAEACGMIRSVGARDRLLIARARVHLGKGRLEDAKLAAKSVVDRRAARPIDRAQAGVLLGVAHWRAGDKAEALAAFAAARRLRGGQTALEDELANLDTPLSEAIRRALA